jgi:sugar transferase (PEP-CTERM/EpsH1 system associated)
VVNVLVVAGMEFGVIKLLNQLDRSRFQPRICCFRSQSERARALLAPDVPVFQIGAPGMPDHELISRLWALLRRERIDIVHVHNWQTMFVGIASARLAGVPVVIHGEHGHDTTAKPWRRVMLKRILSRFADAIVCVSGDLRRELEEEWRVPFHRITYIANGVDVERFRPLEPSAALRAELGLAPDSRVLLNVGGIRAIKDHPTLIRALALLREQVPDVQLLIVGSDYHRQLKAELEVLATELGVRDAVIFAGIRNDVPELLALSDIYVNSSRFEGMSNTILEAQACAVPVVATRVGGTPELIQDGATGRMVPAEDPERMAATFAEVLSDPEGSRRMGAAGRARVIANHSMASMVGGNSRLYSDTWARKKRGGQLTGSQAVRRVVAAALGGTGFLRLSARRDSNTLAILMYHRVLPLESAEQYAFRAMTKPRDIFRAEVAYLARNATLFTLSDAMDRLRAGTLPPRAVVLTFDDAYRDSYEVAWPVLREYGVPATVFVATGSVDGRRRLWWDDVDLWLQEIWCRRPAPGALVKSLPHWVSRRLSDPGASGDPRRISERLVRDLCGVSRDRRRAVLDALRDAAGPAYRENGSEAPLIASWDDLRAMHRAGVEIGSHTVTHSFLDELTQEEASREIDESVERIEEETGERPRSFAFPRGRVLESARPVLDRARIQWSVTTRSGRVAAGDDPHALSRISTGFANLSTGFSESLFELELQGWWARLRATQAPY